MRFGDLPEWATELTGLVHEAVCFGEVSFEASKESTFEDQYAEETCPLPLNLLWREPLFDQLIANVYEPGEVRPLFSFLLALFFMSLSIFCFSK